MASINVKLDCGQLIAWASELSATRIKSVLASSLNRAARAARKQAVVRIAADINVPMARVKKSVGKIIRAAPSRLQASFIVSSSRIGIRNTAGATWSESGGLRAKTHILTGGGSAALVARKAFLIRANGGQFIAIRKGKGTGKKDIRGVYAEGVNTAMAQPNAAPRQQWTRDANGLAVKEVSAGVQAALNNQRAASDSGGDE